MDISVPITGLSAPADRRSAARACCTSSLTAKLREPIIAAFFMVVPFAIYFPVWWINRATTLGNDHISVVPGQQLLFMQMLRDGYFPLWAPGDFGGIPFTVYFVAQAYSPVTWVMYFLEASYSGLALWLLDMARLGLLGMSGWFLYRLGRQLGTGALPAVLMGVAWVGNLRILDILRCGSPLDTSVWIPVALYLAEMLLQRPTLRRVAFYALAQYMMIITGHTQNAFYGIVFINAYALFRSILLCPKTGRRGLAWRLGRLSSLGAAQLLGLALSALLLIPVVADAVPLWKHRTDGGPEYYQSHHMTFHDLLANLTMPWFASFLTSFYSSQALWLLVAGAAVLCILDRARDWAVQRMTIWFMLATLLFCILFSLGPLTPLNEWVNRLCPGLQSFRAPARCMIIGVLAMAIIGGLGLDRLLRSEAGPRLIQRLWTPGLIGFALVGAALAVCVWTGQLRLVSVGAGRVRYSLPLWGVVERHAPINMTCFDAILLVSLMSGALVGVAAMNLLILRLARRGQVTTRTMIFVLLGGMLFEAGFYQRYGTEVVPCRYYTPHSDRFKKQDLYHTRIFEPANIFMFSYKNVAKTKAEIGDYKKSGEMALAEETTAPLRRFLTQGGEPAWRIYYQNLPGREIPRAGLVPGVQVVAGDDLAAIRAMDPTRFAVLDKHHEANHASDQDADLTALATAVADTASTSRPGPAATAIDQHVTVTTYTPNRAGFKVAASQPAMLVYSDSWAAGWNATVDGRPAHIYCVNHLYKGVALTAGEHQVEFIYDPPTFRRGLFISLAAACLTLGLISASLVRHPARAAALAILSLALGVPLAKHTYHAVYSAAHHPGLINFDPDAARPIPMQHSQYLAD